VGGGSLTGRWIEPVPRRRCPRTGRNGVSPRFDRAAHPSETAEALGSDVRRAYTPGMAVQTQNRSQLFRAARDDDHHSDADAGNRLLAERRSRNAVYQTTDGMTRELLRPVRD